MKPVNSTWAFYPMIVVPGIVLLLAPSTVETIMKYYQFREALGGLLQVAYFVGGVPGILLITHLMRKYGVKQIALSQVAMLSLSLMAASFAPWYPLLLTFFVIVGFANGILITLPGVYVTRAAGESSHGAQNVLYSFFSLGVVIGPLLTALIINDNPAMWRWAFRAPALMIIPLSIPVILLSFQKFEGVKKLSRETVKKIIDYSRGLFLGLLMAILLYIAAESAVSMWLITFLKEEHGLSLGAAHWALTGLWAGLTLGRWICGYLTRKTDPYSVLLFLAIASGLTLLIAPLTRSTDAVLVMYPVVGLFYSGIYPILIGYTAWFPTDISAAVFTIFLAAGAAGGAVLPYIVGLVNQFAGLVVGMCSISIPVFGLIVCLYRLRRYLLEGSPEIELT